MGNQQTATVGQDYDSSYSRSTQAFIDKINKNQVSAIHVTQDNKEKIYKKNPAVQVWFYNNNVRIGTDDMIKFLAESLENPEKYNLQSMYYFAGANSKNPIKVYSNKDDLRAFF